MAAPTVTSLRAQLTADGWWVYRRNASPFNDTQYGVSDDTAQGRQGARDLSPEEFCQWAITQLGS